MLLLSCFYIELDTVAFIDSIVVFLGHDSGVFFLPKPFTAVKDYYIGGIPPIHTEVLPNDTPDSVW